MVAANNPMAGHKDGNGVCTVSVGYGSYGAANMAVYNACGAPDAQEGLFHILLANGLVGAVLILALCYSIAKDCRDAGVSAVTNPMLAYLVAMAICSYVEINLAGLFLLGLSLMHCYSLSKLEPDLPCHRAR